MAFEAFHLSLSDHVHRLDAGNQRSCAAERLEAEHRPHDAFDGPMVLFDDVVQVLRLTHLDVRTGVGLNALDGGRVGTALVDSDLLGYTVQTDGLFGKASGSCVISLGAKQEVDRIAAAINGPVQILPLARRVACGSSCQPLLDVVPAAVPREQLVELCFPSKRING